MASCEYHSSVFQSTPLMRGETRTCAFFSASPWISIHSPHARGDLFIRPTHLPRGYFNPLPSCEGRPYGLTPLAPTCIFQSTPLMRGETRSSSSICLSVHYFNPLPSCEGRQTMLKNGPDGETISIHSPHARGDID